MGALTRVSTLRSCCLGREAPNRYEEELWTAQAQHSPLGKDREKNENCVEDTEPKKIEKHSNYGNCVEDTESKKINLDYSCLQYDELSTPIRYYILQHQL